MEKYDSVVVSTRVRLARNIQNIPFPLRLNDESAVATIYKGVKSVCDRLYDYDMFLMNKLNDVDRIALLERHLISPNLADNISTGAVIISKENGISIMVNEEDHIRAQCVLRGYKLEDAYREVSKFDDSIANEMPIAFDSKLGYLTACPTNLGTGMRASVMLFLPALTETHEINRIINFVQKAGLTARGMYGEGSESVGYMYQISNQVTLGITESELLSRVKNVVDKICEAELQSRKQMYSYAGIRLEDKVMRSYGLLMYARRISSGEFMEHIANVKLGVSLGILDLDINMLNTLMELAQPANLCHYGGRKLTEEERDELRANLVREKIKER